MQFVKKSFIELFCFEWLRVYASRWERGQPNTPTEIAGHRCNEHRKDIAMERLLKTAVAAAAMIAIASPAGAAITMTTTTGMPLSYQIFGIANASGNPVYGSSPNNTTVPNVTYTGDANMTMANGFAQLSDANSMNPSLFTVVINPDLDFSQMKFAMQLVSAGTATVYYLLSGSGLDANAFASYTTASAFSGSFAPVSSDSKDNNNYLVSGGTFDGIMIRSTAPIELFEVKQNSYDPAPGAVPEPATWVFMLLGFGGIGMNLRRRRKGALAQIA
ncbi:MAG TPA: PEPxxWA-CTERM sorting domain-containing protein [Sphingomicrobium sp.]|nr:PEPxxWA-CTERM sorting domain-containing protein [Sphingomicrobium sp.]